MPENNSSSNNSGLGCLIVILISVIVGLFLYSQGFAWQSSVGIGLLAGLGAMTFPCLAGICLILFIIGFVVVFAYLNRPRPK